MKKPPWGGLAGIVCAGNELLSLFYFVTIDLRGEISMSDQISPIKTPALSIGASVRAEHDPFVPFRKGRKAALQLAVSLWIAGGLLGVPGAAAA